MVSYVPSILNYKVRDYLDNKEIVGPAPIGLGATVCLGPHCKDGLIKETNGYILI